MTLDELLSVKPDEINKEIYESAIKRFDNVCKPIDGLGDMERLIAKIASIRNCEMPSLSRKVLAIVCADNGVVEEGISQTESSVTSKVARLMGCKGSVAGVMLKAYDCDSLVYDVGMKSDEKFDGVIDKKVANGTKNIVKEAAMSEDECLRAIETGIDIVKDNKDKYDIIATGEMGIGNTTTSTAVICALINEKCENIVGKGAGLTDERLNKKIEVINKAMARASKEIEESYGKKITEDEIKDRVAFEILRQLGGFDIATMAGIFIGGALYHIPVVIDGIISAASALAAACIIPGCEDYMLASHTGKEKGTAGALDKLGLKPVINADLALGEGTGAIMLFPLLDMAYSVYENGPFFADANMEAYKRNDK